MINDTEFTVKWDKDEAMWSASSDVRPDVTFLDNNPVFALNDAWTYHVEIYNEILGMRGDECQL